MVLGLFHSGESNRPCPHLQGHPPRQTASNEPSIRSRDCASKSLPVANHAFPSSSFAMILASQSGSRVTSLLRTHTHFVPAASPIPRVTAAAKPALTPREITRAPARVATAAESSVLPLSTTITR